MKFKITGQYGELSPVRDFKSHSGIDFGMKEGTILRSITEGTARLADYGNQNAGKTVMIDSPDGKTYIYGHLQDFSIENGQHINTGDVIAHSGNSGFSSGPHLHFGIKENGHAVDPTSLAEKVANYAGGDFISGPIPKLLGLGGEALKEHAKEATEYILMGVGEALGELISSIALVGAGVCFILKICGWKDGGRWCGMLLGANVLLKFLGVKV